MERSSPWSGMPAHPWLFLVARPARWDAAPLALQHGSPSDTHGGTVERKARVCVVG